MELDIWAFGLFCSAFRTYNYDIALIKLKRPAIVNNYVNTVCVAGEDEVIPVNSTCFITGENMQLSIILGSIIYTWHVVEIEHRFADIIIWKHIDCFPGARKLQ